MNTFEKMTAKLAKINADISKYANIENNEVVFNFNVADAIAEFCKDISAIVAETETAGVCANEMADAIIAYDPDFAIPAASGIVVEIISAIEMMANWAFFADKITCEENVNIRSLTDALFNKLAERGARGRVFNDTFEFGRSLDAVIASRKVSKGCGDLWELWEDMRKLCA